MSHRGRVGVVDYRPLTNSGRVTPERSFRRQTVVRTASNPGSCVSQRLNEDPNELEKCGLLRGLYNFSRSEPTCFHRLTNDAELGIFHRLQSRKYLHECHRLREYIRVENIASTAAIPRMRK